MKLILRKGRKLPEGSVRIWKDGIKRKKINGKWVPIKNQHSPKMNNKEFAEHLMNKLLQFPWVNTLFNTDIDKNNFYSVMVSVYNNLLSSGKLKRKNILKQLKSSPAELLLNPRMWNTKDINYLKKISRDYHIPFMNIVKFLHNYRIRHLASVERRKVELNAIRSVPLMDYPFEDIFAETIREGESFFSKGLESLLRKDYNYDPEYEYLFEDTIYPYESWTESKQLSLLKKGKIVDMWRNPSSGINGSFIVILENDDGEQIRAIFKPRNTERRELRNGIPDDTQYVREVATYEISKALNINLVPPTVMRDEGSMQMIIGRSEEGAMFADNVLSTEADIFDFEKGTLLDFLIFNTDRHSGNFLFSRSREGYINKMYLVDNGLTLPTSTFDYNSYVYSKYIMLRYKKEKGKYDSVYSLMSADTPLTKTCKDTTIQKLTDDKKTKLINRLHKLGLENKAVNAFIMRLNYIQKKGVIPALDVLRNNEALRIIKEEGAEWL